MSGTSLRKFREQFARESMPVVVARRDVFWKTTNEGLTAIGQTEIQDHTDSISECPRKLRSHERFPFFACPHSWTGVNGRTWLPEPGRARRLPLDGGSAERR